MSQTTNKQCPTPSAKFNAEMYLESGAYYMREQVVIIGLLGAMYGVLTVLSIASAYALTQRRRRIQRTEIMLCLIIVALFTSTTIYMVISILQCQSYFLSFIPSGYRIWSKSAPVAFSFSNLQEEPRLFSDTPEQVKACASAATLTVNVVLGDAIVCWRAWVIWHKNRVVTAVCGLFLLATFVLGAVNTAQSCRPLAGTFSYDGVGPFRYPGMLFEGIPLGIAACVLSLVTNALTTLIVACKAWEQRKRLRGYFVAKVGGSQVEKLLALLVESGAIYSAIWAVVVAYQVGNFKYEYNSVSTSSPIGPQSAKGGESATESRFLDVFGVIMNGALVPMIAIYPTIIIVLVAVNRSHMERGLTQHLEDLPTPHLALTVDTTATNIHGTPGRGGSAVLVIDGQGSRRGDVLQPEHRRDSECTAVEWKVEGTVQS